MSNYKKQKGMMIAVSSFVLKNHIKIIYSLIFLLLFTVIFYIYIFATLVFYNYSISKKQNELDEINLTKVKLESELFKLKNEGISKLSKKYKKIDNVLYIDTKSSLVMKR